VAQDKTPVIRSREMTLKEHIEKEHAGYNASFARKMGVSPQQVTRWLNYNCIWFEGAVYKKQSK
jgi:hypothetical protein